MVSEEQQQINLILLTGKKKEGIFNCMTQKEKVDEPQFRCMDLTRAPGGWLQCMRPLNHPDSQLHWVDPFGSEKITDEQLTQIQSLMGRLEQ